MVMNQNQNSGVGYWQGIGGFLSALAVVCLLAGCEPWTIDVEESTAEVAQPSPPADVAANSGSDTANPVPPPAPATPATDPSLETLPSNPSVPPTPEGSSAELWYFGYKDYDNTFRIRWPTYFAVSLGVGEGSYTLVNGERARFRSFDTDHGAKRPSYTMPGPSGRLNGTVTCVLYSHSGVALAWFRTTAGATTQGRLP